MTSISKWKDLLGEVAWQRNKENWLVPQEIRDSGLKGLNSGWGPLQGRKLG